MKIDKINQPGAAQQLRDIAPRHAPASVTNNPQGFAERLSDRSEVAGDVAAEARQLDAAKLVLDALPDIRADKIALARQRLESGFYNNPKVQDEIAAKLVADPESVPAGSISTRQIGEIKRRLSEGFYDSSGAIEKIADGLAKDAEE